MMSDRGWHNKMVSQEQTLGSWVLGEFILREKWGISAELSTLMIYIHRSNVFQCLKVPSHQNLCLKLFFDKLKLPHGLGTHYSPWGWRRGTEPKKAINSSSHRDCLSGNGSSCPTVKQQILLFARAKSENSAKGKQTKRGNGEQGSEKPFRKVISVYTFSYNDYNLLCTARSLAWAWLWCWIGIKLYIPVSHLSV